MFDGYQTKVLARVRKRTVWRKRLLRSANFTSTIAWFIWVLTLILEFSSPEGTPQRAFLQTIQVIIIGPWFLALGYLLAQWIRVKRVKQRSKK